MIQILHILQDKFHLRKTPKEGKIQEQFDTGYDDLLSLYEEWKNKSIQDNCYYLLGSSYFKSYIDEKYPPEVIRDFILPHCIRIDSKGPQIPLEMGEMLERLSKTTGKRLGIHRSDSILSQDVREDPILKKIITNGLKNNGAAMQGLISYTAPLPSQTIHPASDMIQVCDLLKSSFRGSKGSLLVLLPKDVVDLDFDFHKGVNPNSIYEHIGKEYLIRPEFIVGYIDTQTDRCIYHSKEELLEHYKQKEI